MAMARRMETGQDNVQELAPIVLGCAVQGPILARTVFLFAVTTSAW